MKRVAFAILLLILAAQVHAVAIGVNRASLNFEEVLRGGYAEDVVTVTTDSPDPISGEVLVSGEAAAWLNVSSDFTFSSSRPYELHVIVQPPTDAQIQSYDINLSVLTGVLAQTNGTKLGTSTRASFRIPIKLGMTGTERVACTVGGVTVYDAERGEPLQLQVSILNRGNVRINPEISVEVFNQLQSSTLGKKTTDFGARILPTRTESATRQLPFDLPVDQYWAAISVPECGYSNLFTFDVLEAGGIKDDGDFIRIDAPAWANTGDIVPIKAVFRNKGVRAVRAQFKGSISRIDNDQIVKVINSEQYVVDPETTAEIQTFFNPLVGGQYKVSGKVYYNNKLTSERETLINVNGSPVSQSGGVRWSLVIGMVIIIVILLLLILIRRRKRA